ncbi:hypothetical protein CEQ90_08970 [Lewinellaceae bacterium SD302]|nr:hypothetical protein CEQ90_08970 [Lewinellaceae bacterium SD302]
MGGSKTRVLFFRRLINPGAGSNGGNLKLRDGFNHLAQSENFEPRVYFHPDTRWPADLAGNHWADLKQDALPKWKIRADDLLFFSGHDWQSLTPEQRRRPPVPVINIVQPRHVRKQDRRREFLRHPAIRIAKSEHGASILRKYGVNGPLFVIPDAIDLDALPPIPAEKDIDILIPGLKQPDFAQKLYDNLQSWNQKGQLGLNIYLQLPPKLPERMDFLRLIARSKLIACVPLETARGAEGFYLPALEAMALRSLVVCPHAIGNVDHCLDGVNCLVPKFTVKDIAKVTKQAWNLPTAHREELIQGGLKTARKHHIEQERTATIQLVKQAPELWAQPELFLPSPSETKQESWLVKLRRILGF